MKLLNDLFNFILLTTSKYGIDESHDVSHSMNVLHYAQDIYEAQVYIYPPLKHYERVIYIAALLHDMCDKKYMDETEGLKEICNYLKPRIEEKEIEMVKNIVSTMSYSKVKVNGFPDFGDYMWAYHVVREADLLSAYDFDRCMIYHLKQNDRDIDSSFANASKLFENRVFKHYDDGLLLTEYSKENYMQYQSNALNRIGAWKKILKNYVL
uniref:Uncharacterized protein n=1 Tax=viral metagenome TaxID=1070528 RepID=A0A6C0EIR0_9ZZZZ